MRFNFLQNPGSAPPNGSIVGPAPYDPVIMGYRALPHVPVIMGYRALPPYIPVIMGYRALPYLEG